MAAVEIGKAKIVSDGKEIHAVSGNGFLSVENGKCTLLANSFDLATEIDSEKVKAELADAEALLKIAKSESDKTIAKDRIKLANLRLAVIEMYLPELRKQVSDRKDTHSCIRRRLCRTYSRECGYRRTQNILAVCGSCLFTCHLSSLLVLCAFVSFLLLYTMQGSIVNK